MSSLCVFKIKSRGTSLDSLTKDVCLFLSIVDFFTIRQVVAVCSDVFLLCRSVFFLLPFYGLLSNKDFQKPISRISRLADGFFLSRFSFFLVSVIVISFIFSFFLISGFYLSHNHLFLDVLMFYIAVLPFQFLSFHFFFKHF